MSGKELTQEAKTKLESAKAKRAKGQDYKEEKKWFLENGYGWVVREYDL